MKIDIRGQRPGILQTLTRAKDAVDADIKKTHPGLAIGVLGLGTGILLHNIHDYLQAH